VRRSSRWTDLIGRADDDEGSATLEFATAGLLLLLPLVALIVVLGTIQSGAFAVQAAAAQAARIVAGGGDPVALRESAATAIEFALDDYGFAVDSADVLIRCEPVSPCPSGGGTVTVTIDLAVPIPMVPGLLGSAPPSVTLSSTATRPVSRFAILP
jgi:Flp pilus assembly protein TadG